MENQVSQSVNLNTVSTPKTRTNDSPVQPTPKGRGVRWTDEEDKRLIRQVMAFPQNLNRCFIMVSEELGRSKGGVANHWYTVLSKKPEVYCFFTASSTYISKNRKNGVGVFTKPSIWDKFLRILKKIC